MEIPDEKDYQAINTVINQRLSNIEQKLNLSNKLKESILSALSEKQVKLDPKQIGGVLTEVQHQSDSVRQMIE